jgi:transcriptional regulator with XRE-family HTH domain
MSNSKPISPIYKENYIKLGLNIAYFRKRLGMTQEELAEKIGISRAHLSAIEAPNIIRSFSLELLFMMAKELNVEPCKLLEFRD